MNKSAIATSKQKQRERHEFTREMRKPPSPKEFIVQAEHLVSHEVYCAEDDSIRPVLPDISLDVRRGECWGILGDEAFEIELLLEIIGCVRPYASGRVRLVERGMMRKKRKVLPHVFYIAGSDTTIPNMNVLEYLMFVTANTGEAAVDRQIAILERLLDCGLHEITLTPIKFLSHAQRAIIALLGASFSDTLLFIFSVSQVHFDDAAHKAVDAIARYIRESGAALLIGTQDCDLVQTACSHAMFLIHSHIANLGTLDEVTALLDKRIFTLRIDGDAESAAEALFRQLPDLLVQPAGQSLHLYDYQGVGCDFERLTRALLALGLTPDSVRISHKSVKNAYKEALSNDGDTV